MNVQHDLQLNCHLLAKQAESKINWLLIMSTIYYEQSINVIFLQPE
ncbi:29962_t:CDS:2, partial [Gigaspora margarita]